MTNCDIKSKKISAFLDISGDLCPMTFVKTRLFLEGMLKGQVVEITLAEGEPLDNLPSAVQLDGHEILSLEQLPTRVSMTEQARPNLYCMRLRVDHGHGD